VCDGKDAARGIEIGVGSVRHLTFLTGRGGAVNARMEELVFPSLHALLDLRVVGEGAGR
jgi:hypothetical protein